MLELRKNPASKDGLIIYPNPVTNVLRIESNQYLEAGTEIEIINTLGQRVLKMPYSNTLNVSGLVNGVYFLQINSAAGNFVYPTRFVKIASWFLQTSA